MSDATQTTVTDTVEKVTHSVELLASGIGLAQKFGLLKSVDTTALSDGLEKAGPDIAAAVSLGFKLFADVAALYAALRPAATAKPAAAADATPTGIVGANVTATTAAGTTVTQELEPAVPPAAVTPVVA